MAIKSSWPKNPPISPLAILGRTRWETKQWHAEFLIRCAKRGELQNARLSAGGRKSFCNDLAAALVIATLGGKDKEAKTLATTLQGLAGKNLESTLEEDPPVILQTPHLYSSRTRTLYRKHYLGRLVTAILADNTRKAKSCAKVLSVLQLERHRGGHPPFIAGGFESNRRRH